MARAHLRWWLLTATMVATWALFLAADHLGLPENEMQENRVLAEFPAQPPTSLATLKSYREGVDAYVADQFPARTRLIGAMNYLRYRLGYSGTSRVLVGRKHWLFYDDGGHLRQLRHGEPLSAADADAWAGTLAARTAKLQAQGARYLFVAPPVKEQVYPELAPRWARGATGSDGDDLRAAAERAGVPSNLLVLRETLIAARAQHPDVYSPYDTHWTGYGAHAAYVALIRRFTELGLAVGEPRPLSDFKRRARTQLQQPQDLAYMLGIASHVRQDFPEFGDERAEAAARTEYLTERRDWTGDRIIDTGATGKPVLQWAGDSFSNELLPYLYPHFSRIVASHHEQGWFREDLTAKYHPDVVVLEVLAGGMRHAMNPALPRPAEMPAALAPMPAAPAPAATAAPTAAPAFAPAGLPREGGSILYTHRCNLESIALAGKRIAAAGWMADVDGGASGQAVRLLLVSTAGSFAANAPIGIERPDVASYFAKPGLAHSGFGFELGAEPLPAGDYEAYLLQEHGARTLVCSTGRKLSIPGVAK